MIKMSTPKGCTNLKLRRLSRTVARGYDADMRPLGLTGAQYALLSHVVRLGPVAPGALAAALGLDPSTLTRNLQALQAAGWVAQAPGPDARSHRLVATEAGQALRTRAQQRWRASQERINAVLGPDRVVALHALLDECAALLDAAASDQATT
jgi:DNA-binding MarR family transcriptional regulator